MIKIEMTNSRVITLEFKNETLEEHYLEEIEKSISNDVIRKNGDELLLKISEMIKVEKI